MMKRLLVLFFSVLVLAGMENELVAEPRKEQGSKEEAKAMIEKAAEWFKKYGREKTLAEISRAGTEKKGAFLDRDLYIFAYDFNGIVLAHGANPKLVGVNLFDMQDADGRYLIRGLIDVATKGSGWYYYKWPNPITKKVEEKKAYVLKIDESLWIGCGVYGKEVQSRVVMKIGVLLSFDQDRYTDSMKGMLDQLDKEGYGERAVKITIENAKGSHVRATEIARKFAAARLDLIAPMGTLAAVAVMKEIKNIPVVFSMVYDPLEAGIARDWKSSGKNSTGATPRIPPSILVQRLKEFAPVKRLAVLYTPGEKNTESQLKDFQALQADARIKIVPVPLTRKDEVPQILPEVMHTADAIYLTGGSVIGATIPLIVDSANRAKVITITHLDDMVKNGVLLGVCADSYRVGRLAGEKAAKVLKGVRPSSIPIDAPKKIDVILNLRSVKAGPFQIPDGFMTQVTKTVE
jgi:putative ABC transport system substrate-binding protein